MNSPVRFFLLVITCGSLTLSAMASPPNPPPLLDTTFNPEPGNQPGKARWMLQANRPTPGCLLSFEESQNLISWSAVPNGSFYATDTSEIKLFVCEGPWPPEDSGSGAQPPSGSGETWSWQLVPLSLKIETQASHQEAGYRLSCASYTPSGASAPLPAWDTVRTDLLPGLPAGTRYFALLDHTDLASHKMYMVDVNVVSTTSPHPADSLPTATNETEGLGVYQQVYPQFLGRLTSPYQVAAPATSGPHKYVRLRRTELFTNGVADWWLLKYNFQPWATPGMDGWFDPAGDSDHDGTSNINEWNNGTPPSDPDKDGDGFTVSEEANDNDANDHPPPMTYLSQAMKQIFFQYTGVGYTYDPSEPPSDSGEKILTNHWLPFDMNSGVEELEDTSAWNSPSIIDSQLATPPGFPELPTKFTNTFGMDETVYGALMTFGITTFHESISQFDNTPQGFHNIQWDRKEGRGNAHQSRFWLQHKPKETFPVTQSYIAVRETWQGDYWDYFAGYILAPQTDIMDVFTLTVPAGATVSAPKTIAPLASALAPPGQAPADYSFWSELTLVPIEFVVPDVRPGPEDPILAGGPGEEGGDPPADGTGGNPGDPPEIIVSDPLERTVYKVATELKVAKMEGVIDDFYKLKPEVDNDHFRIRIPKVPDTIGKVPITSIKIKLETYKADGSVLDPAGAPLQLVKDMTSANGVPRAWRTPPMLLVSDDVDDGGYQQQIYEDEHEYDWTHKAVLGGYVKLLSIQFNNEAATPLNLRCEVQKPKKTLRINIVIMEDAVGGKEMLTPEAAITTAKEDFKRAIFRFSQIGIFLELGSCEIQPRQSIDIPGAGSVVTDSIPLGLANVDPIERTLVDHFGTPNNDKDFTFFYCKQVYDQGVRVRGFSRYEGRDGYLNNAFISSLLRGPFSFAHELGHLLTKRWHYGGQTSRDYEKSEYKAHPLQVMQNLMRDGGTSDTDEIGSSKRLYEIQQSFIFPKP